MPPNPGLFKGQMLTEKGSKMEASFLIFWLLVLTSKRVETGGLKALVAGLSIAVLSPASAIQEAVWGGRGILMPSWQPQRYTFCKCLFIYFVRENPKQAPYHCGPRSHKPS